MLTGSLRKYRLLRRGTIALRRLFEVSGNAQSLADFQISKHVEPILCGTATQTEHHEPRVNGII